MDEYIPQADLIKLVTFQDNFMSYDSNNLASNSYKSIKDIKYEEFWSQDGQ